MFPPKYFVFLAVLDEFLLTSVQFGRKKIRFEKSDKIVDTVTLKFPLVKLQPSSPQLTLATLQIQYGYVLIYTSFFLVILDRGNTLDCQFLSFEILEKHFLKLSKTEDFIILL